MTTTAQPVFASVANAYLEAGWPAVMPVPAETKSPPPTGYSGAEGHDTPAEVLAAWIHGGYAHHSVALRMPDGVIGIDVDEYDKVSTHPVTGEVKTVRKRGAATLAKAIDQWGPLPATWTSTARGDGPSRIAFYRAPAQRYATAIQPDIEIIQRHHRYAVVWPSPHGDVAAAYTWYAPDGSPAQRIPGPADLPELPPSWVSGLAEGAATASLPSASHASGDALLHMLNADARPACAVMYDALDAAARLIAESLDDDRHETMTPRIHHLVMSAAHGHPGMATALPALRERWLQATGGVREDEFDRMFTTSARKAVTAISGVRQLPDPCTTMGGPQWAGVQGVVVDARPRPLDDRQPDEDEEFEPLQLDLPPMLVDPSWREVIGAHPFDSLAELDQLVAEEMLLRCFYMVRRASDTKDAWLQRGAEQWSLEGNLAGRIVAECAGLMPEGDPEKVKPKEEPTDAQLAYKRRKRMMSNGPAAAVASAIKRQTDGGRHPATVRLVDLDNNPEVLWAGGWPFDLRASLETPTTAQIDPYGPHLVAAGVRPADVPTPRWDAFLKAVWPDEDVRNWALRVLSIAFTGYADAALPVLFGNGGTGKTSLVTLLMEVLGSYAHAADHRLLGSGEGHASIVFALKGRRLSFIDEAMRDGSRNLERLKQLTGGGELTGNAMNQNPITFKPTHTLVLTSNTAPTVSDPALRRRVRIIPCDGDPAEVRRRRQALTGPRWAIEAQGVMARMMREAAAWLADPDTALTAAAPLSVQFALGELVREQDVVAQWLAEAVTPYPQGMKASVLYTGFRGWCKDLGVRESSIPSLTAWGMALNEHGIEKIERRDANYRPLMFRADGGFGPPTPQTPPSNLGSPSQALGFAGSVEGLRTVGGGSEPQPSTPHNAGSGAVFASSVEGVDTSSSSFTYEREEEESTYSGAIGKNCQPSTVDHVDPPSSQIGTRVEGLRNPPPNCPQSETPSTDEAKGTTGPVSSRSVTKAEAARRAAEDKITKAEARRLVADENRRAAIDAAAGEHIGLPAVATREGYVMPVTLEQAEAIVRTATARAGALSVDCETSGYPVGHALYALRMVQLGDEQAVVAFDPDDHPQRATITALVSEAAYLHAFSATADLVPLAVAGLIDHEEAWGRMLDVAVAAQLSEPISKGASVEGLKQVAPTILGPEATVPAADAARAKLFSAMGATKESTVTTPPEKNGWHLVDTRRATFIRYGAADVLDTAALARRLPWPETKVLDRERLAQRMVGRITFTGVPIDAAHVDALMGPSEQRHAEASARVAAFGIENPTSNVEIARTLDAMGAPLTRTPKGAPSAAKDALKPLAEADGDVGDLVRAVLDVRHETTLLGLFLRPYAEMCAHGDGRARPTVYTVSAKTGRMSCVRPNIQQMPREGGVRACLMADPGHLLISADFSGIEIRVAAALSQDPTMLQFLLDGRDLHEEVALQVFGPDAETSAAKGRPAPHKRNRYKVKSGVFGRFYGGGVPTLSSQMGVPQEVAQRMVDVLDSMFPRLSEWSAQMQQQARRGNTRFESYSGRVIHLPKLATHAAVNYAVQGSARELLIDTLIRWDRTPWGRAPLFPVHDELVVMVPEAEAPDALAELSRCMSGELYGVEIKASTNEPSASWQDSV